MWKPLRRRGLGLTQLMIVTIGMSLALQYVFQYAIGGSQVKVTLQSFETSSFGPVAGHQHLLDRDGHRDRR